MQRNVIGTAAIQRLKSPQKQNRAGWIAQSSSDTHLNPKSKVKNFQPSKSAFVQNDSNDFLGRDDKPESAATEGADDDMNVSFWSVTLQELFTPEMMKKITETAYNISLKFEKTEQARQIQQEDLEL